MAEHELKTGTYEHFKGKRYFVVGVAKHSETLEEYAVYRKLYADKSMWVRPLEMFTGQVTKDGKTVPRFRFISENEIQ